MRPARGRRLCIGGAALALAVGLAALPTGMVRGATTATPGPGANPADCPGGVLSPHAQIAINTDADWTAANGVSAGDGSTTTPYVISCISITVPATPSAGTGISVASAAADKAFLIRDVQVTGPGGAQGAGTTSQTGIQVAAQTSGDVEQVTASGFSIGLNGGATGTGTLRIAHSLFTDDHSGVSNGSGTAVIDGNTFDSNSTGISGASGVISNNTIADNGEGAGELQGTITGNLVENNTGVGMYAGRATVRGNTIDGNGVGLVVAIPNATVDSNTVDGNASVGIDISGTAWSSITNNTIEGNGGPAIESDYANANSVLGGYDNSIVGNHIGHNPYGIVLSYGMTYGNVVANTDWTDGQQSIANLGDLNAVVDAGSNKAGITRSPVAFADYLTTQPAGAFEQTPTCQQIFTSTIGGSCGLGGADGPHSTGPITVETGITWTFGDGSPAVSVTDPLQGHGASPPVSHVYAAAGTYTATLTVSGTDQNNQPVSYSDTVPVTIS